MTIQFLRMIGMVDSGNSQHIVLGCHSHREFRSRGDAQVGAIILSTDRPDHFLEYVAMSEYSITCFQFLNLNWTRIPKDVFAGRQTERRGCSKYFDLTIAIGIFDYLPVL